MWPSTSTRPRVAVPGLATIGLVLVLGNIGYLVATVVVLDPVPDTRPAEIVAAARRTLRRVGSGSLYPYQLAPECTPFADEAATAALATASVGRCSVALGDPAGAPSAATGVFADWLGGCRADDRLPVVYQASEPRARTLRAQGWRSVLVGREAIIDPRAFDIGSSRVANLRHTVTRSRKGGIRTLWSSSGVVGLSEPRLVAGLVRLDAEWRRTAGPQMRFTVGHFDPRETGDTAIAVAVDEHDEPVAFAVLRPTGADDGWMLDVRRRARGGVPGAIEACLVTAIQALGEMGVPKLSLGLAPLAGLDRTGDPAPGAPHDVQHPPVVGARRAQDGEGHWLVVHVDGHRDRGVAGLARVEVPDREAHLRAGRAAPLGVEPHEPGNQPGFRQADGAAGRPQGADPAFARAGHGVAQVRDARRADVERARIDDRLAADEHRPPALRPERPRPGLGRLVHDRQPIVRPAALQPVGEHARGGRGSAHGIAEGDGAAADRRRRAAATISAGRVSGTGSSTTTVATR